MKKQFLISLIISLFFPLSVFGATNSGIETGPYIQRVTKKAATVLLTTETEKKLSIKYKKTGNKKWKTKTDSSSSTSHRYRLLRLKPNTDYSYYIIDENRDRLSKTYTFHTRRKIKKNPLKIAVLGDSRNTNSNQILVAQQMLHWNPDMVFHTGDICANGIRDEFIDDFFIPYQSLLAEKPFYTALGNHEYRTNEGYYYKEFFELPQKNSSSEDYYSFNENKIHIVSINTSLDYSEGSEMYDWLVQDLENTNKKWKIVIMHHPPYSSGAHGSTQSMWDNLVPLFEHYKVDLVLTGHDHVYERIQEIDGVRYVVTAGGGAPLYSEDNPINESEKFLSDYHFVGLKVYPKKIKLQAIDKYGYVFDKITIK